MTEEKKSEIINSFMCGNREWTRKTVLKESKKVIIDFLDFVIHQYDCGLINIDDVFSLFRCLNY